MDGSIKAGEVDTRQGFTLPGIDFSELIALALSLAAVLAAYLVADRIYDRIPHIEDEIAYVWQARAMAAGAVTAPTPPLENRFLVPFVVDHEGLRFGKYPLGWPALLSVGIRLGLRAWVNPLLGGLAVWLTYVLGRRLLGRPAGLIAAVLTATSPFFLMISGSLLSHALGLVLALAFVLAWWDVVGPREGAGSPEAGRLPGWIPVLAAGGAIGALAVTRPFTAAGAALPFVVQAIVLFVRGPGALRRRFAGVALIGALIGSLHLLWQAAAAGDPFFNLYTLWWPYDRAGFGPGFGVTDQGHNLNLAWINTAYSLRVGWHDLFGWPGFSWILLPFGVWAVRRDGRTLLAGSVAPVLLVFYGAYWVGSWTYGPRYQYEGLFSLALLSAAGLCLLAGWPLRPGERDSARQGAARLRPLLAAGLFAALLAVNLAMYLPVRLDSMRALYGISGAALAPFEAAEGSLAPAVVIVHADHWTGYGALLDLQDPFLTSPFIFMWGAPRGIHATLADYFPGRAIFHYYPEEPRVFYTGPRP
ncbi:MAG TPA: hypothetical protein VMN57_07750 [Anaerolineales bacterium]|nr:hypothetical protein [Anaerolineales bacterium]